MHVNGIGQSNGRNVSHRTEFTSSNNAQANREDGERERASERKTPTIKMTIWLFECESNVFPERIHCRITYIANWAYFTQITLESDPMFFSSIEMCLPMHGISTILIHFRVTYLKFKPWRCDTIVWIFAPDATHSNTHNIHIQNQWLNAISISI